MTNPSKRKGTAFESACRDYLADVLGRRIERLPAGATLDRGDLTGVDGVAVECKAVKQINLAAIVDEAVAEAANVGPGTLPLAIIKRRQRGVEHAYAVMPLESWCDLYLRGER